MCCNRQPHQLTLARRRSAPVTTQVQSRPLHRALLVNAPAPTRLLRCAGLRARQVTPSVWGSDPRKGLAKTRCSLAAFRARVYSTAFSCGCSAGSRLRCTCAGCCSLHQRDSRHAPKTVLAYVHSAERSCEPMRYMPYVRQLSAFSGGPCCQNCSRWHADTLRRSDDRSRVHASSLRFMALTFMVQLYDSGFRSCGRALSSAATDDRRDIDALPQPAAAPLRQLPTNSACRLVHQGCGDCVSITLGLFTISQLVPRSGKC